MIYMKKSKLKQKLFTLETNHEALLKRIESLEKELGLEYRVEWKEPEMKPLIEGKPIPPWPKLELVCHHVKPKSVEWKRFTKLPSIKEVQDERKTSAESSEKTT